MPSAVKPAAFSRLQLAAALVEYDNDISNPEAFRSAHESAIFAHLRRSEGLIRPRRSVDYLGVAVPSETESDSGRRKSRASISALRNPFGTADDEDEPPEDVGMEVDLTSWGLDAFMEKDKGRGKGKEKQKSEVLPNPHPARNDQSISGDTQRGRAARSKSVGTLNDFGVGGAFLDADGGRPDSVGRVRSSLDLEQSQRPQVPPQRRRASIHALIETLPVHPPLHSVPFPSVSVSGRSSSPGPEETFRPESRASRLDLQPTHVRTRSNASINSQLRFSDGIKDEKIDKSAVRSPSPDCDPRFDPKVNRVRSMSNATVGTMTSKNVLADENPFSLRPPSPSRSSRFDPKTRSRTMSVNSRGTRALPENGLDAESRRDRPYSTVELLRPKVLVMPSPLQSAAPSSPPPPAIRPRSGFSTSTDGPPLPPGARSARPASDVEFASVPIASNSFTPNPRASLSLSQLAFRNTLLVGGQRDIAYSDIDRHLPCAEQEGEQAQFEEDEEEDSPVPTSIALPTVPPPTEVEIRRPAGKLYGRSLIDNLEHRKAEMKQKARTFQGDGRPSMMFRGQIRRSSALIDPTAIGAQPLPQNLDARPHAQTLNRHNSENGKLLVDKSEEKLFPTSASAPNIKSRSVFGVDTLWDREMAKLKEIEARERAETEERKKREQEGAGRSERKKKRGKPKHKGNDASPQPECAPYPEGPSESRISSEPPTLPGIREPALRGAPVVDAAEESESESDNDNIPLGKAIDRTTSRAADSWVAESSDEDNGPRRTTGVGPRYPNKGVPSTPQIPPLSQDDGDDSEEDVPLITAVERVAKRATHLPPPRLVEDDEDDDKPLAAVISEGKLSLPSFSFDNLSGGHRVINNDVDDDDQPLGLRTSQVPMASQISLAFTGGGEDDDKPLAFHPEQQRRMQHQILAQAHQQQQMMIQAQMHNSICFGAPAMGSGFFGPPMGTPLVMMGMPVAPPSPPVHDAGKFGRVDKWRRDVAVEGEH